MKSSGNRARFLLTASLKRKVGTPYKPARATADSNSGVRLPQNEWMDDGALTEAGKALVEHQFPNLEVNPRASEPWDESNPRIMAQFILKKAVAVTRWREGAKTQGIRFPLVNEFEWGPFHGVATISELGLGLLMGAKLWRNWAKEWHPLRVYENDMQEYGPPRCTQK